MQLVFTPRKEDTKKERRKKSVEPRLSRAAMESLPSDVLSVFLRKLAVQDPRSILSLATCACRTFHREAENDRGLWKEAFFGGNSWYADQCKDERLEAEILILGGLYKQLLKARWAVPGCLSPEQRPRGGLVTGNGGESTFWDSLYGAYKLNKHLVAWREKGRLVLSGFLLQGRPEVLREGNDFGFKNPSQGQAPDTVVCTNLSFRLEPFFSEEFVVYVGRLKPELARSGRVARNANYGLEIRKYMNDVFNLPGNVSSTDSRAWVCGLDYNGRDNVWASIFDGEFFCVR